MTPSRKQIAVTILDFPGTPRATAGAPSRTAPHQTSIMFRSTEMSLIHEELARAHSQELRPTDHQRRAMRLAAARRLERRAARARQRARRLSLAAMTMNDRD
jgi:uncharacterized protein with von Willebrand factor type A (vWA) domain